MAREYPDISSFSLHKILDRSVSAGASGGGEDRRLKKNIEYILVYAKNFSSFNTFKPVFKNTPLMRYIDEMKEDGKSYKYTNVLYPFFVSSIRFLIAKS